MSRFPVEKQIVKLAIHHQKALLEKRLFLVEISFLAELKINIIPFGYTGSEKEE